MALIENERGRGQSVCGDAVDHHVNHKRNAARTLSNHPQRSPTLPLMKLDLIVRASQVAHHDTPAVSCNGVYPNCRITGPTSDSAQAMNPGAQTRHLP